MISLMSNALHDAGLFASLNAAPGAGAAKKEGCCVMLQNLSIFKLFVFGIEFSDNKVLKESRLHKLGSHLPGGNVPLQRTTGFWDTLFFTGGE